jgi:hypothetical protein
MALLAIKSGNRQRLLATTSVQALSPAARDLADRLDEILEPRQPQKSPVLVALSAFAVVLVVRWAAFQVTLG